MKLNGIILAAGFGTRLAPLTLQIPKPVLPLCGEPMLLGTLKRLADAGAEQIAVNTHHLPEKVEECVRNSPFAEKVKLYHEPEILGTAGPLINAKDLLTDCDYFLLHNGDVVSDFDLKRMIREHIDSGASLTMALIDGPENRVQVKDNCVVDILHKRVPEGIPGTVDMTYACVSVFSKDFFDALPDTVQNFSFLNAWLKALELGKKINVFQPDPGYFWSDIGSFSQYFQAHQTLMKETPLICGEGSVISENALLTGFNSIGKHCRINAGTHLHNCIVLDGAEPEPGYSGWEIHGKGFRIHKDQRILRALPVFDGETAELTFRSLPEQGSDRKFYRVLDPEGNSRILMVSNAADNDFERFLFLGEFFHKYKLYTPAIYRFNREDFTVLMEDLGDGTLYNLGYGKDEAILYPLYAAALDAIADFQKRGAAAVGKEDLSCRMFTDKVLHWESEYFFENFLCGLCGMKFEDRFRENLLQEFDLIAKAANRLPYVPIHRDFQSQNILLQNGKIRFVDFQGFRFGPYTYDLAALIKDPYMDLSKPLRKRLEQKAKDLFPEFSSSFERDYLVSSLQRNMQALGAYGFLSLKKGKMKYLAYAAPCLNLLLEGVEELLALQDPDLHPQHLLQACRQAKEILPDRLKILIK